MPGFSPSGHGVPCPGVDPFRLRPASSSLMPLPCARSPAASPLCDARCRRCHARLALLLALRSLRMPSFPIPGSRPGSTSPSRRGPASTRMTRAGRRPSWCVSTNSSPKALRIGRLLLSLCNDKALIGSDLLVRDEFILRPGDVKTIRRKSHPDLAAIGVVAGYRDLAQADWRAVQKIDPRPRSPGTARSCRPTRSSCRSTCSPRASSSSPSSEPTARDHNDRFMSWYNKVAWSEGLFLRPQLFQQQERYLEHLRAQACGVARSFLLGLQSLQHRCGVAVPGQARARQRRRHFFGRHALRCAGPDAAACAAHHPAGASRAGHLSRRAHPHAQWRGNDFRRCGASTASLARFSVFDTELRDANSVGQGPKTVQLSRLRLRCCRSASSPMPGSAFRSPRSRCCAPMAASPSIRT
jgi:hypothetical protein